MRARIVLRGLIAVLSVASVSACWGERPEQSPARTAEAPAIERSARLLEAAPPRTQPGPWFAVDAAEDRRLRGRSIYYQGPRQAPVSLRREPVVLPLGPEDVPGEPLLVQVVLSDTGRVARARILHDPMLPGVGSEVLQRRAVDALRAYRLEPAHLDGRPVAVYFSLSVEMRGESGDR